MINLIRTTAFDAPHITVVTDPAWLLAPLYARDAADLGPDAPDQPGPLVPPARPAAVDRALAAAAEADWPAWWQAACEFRPGPPAPRTLDLVHFSPALTELWRPVEREFDHWRRTRPALPAAAHDRPRITEHALLSEFADTNGRAAHPRTLRILPIPTEGPYLYSPAAGMLIVSSSLRGDPIAYRAALEPLLPQHF